MLAIRQVLGALLTAAAVAGLTPADVTEGGDTKILVADSAVRQAQLKRAYEQFRGKLAILAGRLESSSDQKDRDRAKVLRAVLKEAATRGVEVKFDSLIRSLSKKEADKNLDILSQVIKENKELRDDLLRIIAMLAGDDRDKLLAQKRADALKLLAELKELRDKQARMQARTEMGKHEAKDLKPEQEKITGKTKDLRDRLETPKDDKANSPSEEEKQAVKTPLEQANKEQKDSEGKLGKGDKDGAGNAQGKAVTKIDEAIRRLEELIRQIRQEEQERKLTDLLARARRMLEVEKQVFLGTEALWREIQKIGKADVAQAARANKLAEAQLGNLRDAEAALKIIREEGSAVAFEEVFDQLAKDMDVAQRRLGRVEIDDITLAVEKDVIATLQEIIHALEKAIKETQNNNPPPPGSPGGKPPLVNLLQQLKMVHALQRRVNSRTELYGNRYRGEQLPQAKTERERERFEQVQKELKDLAGRQDRIAKVTKEIGKENPNAGAQ